MGVRPSLHFDLVFPFLFEELKLCLPERTSITTWMQKVVVACRQGKVKGQPASEARYLADVIDENY